MIKNIITNRILKNFFVIPLTSKERQTAIESVELKYVPAIKSSLFYSLLCLPAILFLDMNIIVLVLTPITMVSGTAWFAVSLANMKKKFESFGTELTVDLFESFVVSLLLLLLIAVVAVNPTALSFLTYYKDWLVIKLIAGLLASIVVARISIKIFLGALKYDINDAMLTGQAEAAQKYYTKSLSFFQQSAVALRTGKSLDVANYYIANSFFELFSYIKIKLNFKNKTDQSLDELIEISKKMKLSPNSDQEKIDEMGTHLVESFLHFCNGVNDSSVDKSIDNIKFELNCIKDKTSKESQQMTDTRFASIFQEISELIEEAGETLFE